MPDSIRIRGARQHNLKNIDVELPRDAFVVVTGPSGSGKTSLAFDTIYAEAQRRFVESLSVYARQFLEQLERPDADSIEGLSPAIAISQQITKRGPGATLATVTEIDDYLRLLFSRAGIPWCNTHEHPISRFSPQAVVDHLLSLPEKSKVQLLAPIVRSERGEHCETINDLRKKGFVRVRVNGEQQLLEEEIKLDSSASHDIEVVVDRVVIQEGVSSRLAESIETCYSLGEGLIQILVETPSGERSEELLSERYRCPECGLEFESMEPRLFSDSNEDGVVLRDAVRFCDSTIAELRALSVENAIVFFGDVQDGPADVVSPLVSAINQRLEFLKRTGLGYLTLNRSARTLSGGEAQRARIAGQLGSALSGVLYVLDEPSIGLHPRDNKCLLESLIALRDLGNTVIVVEHDAQAIRAADYVLELGPRAGIDGGELIFSGTPGELEKSNALSGQFLSGKLTVHAPEQYREQSGSAIKISGARLHNLQNIDVEFPLGMLIAITGVSGSGKSSLINDTLYPAVKNALRSGDDEVGEFDRISGLDAIDKVISIDQSPIGRSPRSTPATYVDCLGAIRELFSGVQKSRVRGYQPGRFSFNNKGGRCETCQGAGRVKIEMQFLPDVYVSCESCGGSRFNRDTLEIYYKGKSIAEVLEMTVVEAAAFFRNIPAVFSKLESLSKVGLGYLKLGQSGLSLSGGEAQRVKLAAELAKKQTGKTLYVLDEPTTGLHAVDVDQLLKVLHHLVDLGNTVLIIEHNLDVIKSADWVIDLGPDGGEAGGSVVAFGPPDEIAASEQSITGRFLRSSLD